MKQSFREFLRAVENGDESCYLTTQNIAEDEHGPLELFGSPVTELLHDIPLVPHILGNLGMELYHVVFSSNMLYSVVPAQHVDGE